MATQAAKKMCYDAITEYMRDFRVAVPRQDEGRLNQLQKKLESYVNLFARYDSDASGDIDILELQQVMEHLGEARGRIELKKMIKEVDENSDGKLFFREFCNMMLIYGGVIPGPILKGGDVKRLGDGGGGAPAASSTANKKKRKGALKRKKRGDVKLEMKFNDRQNELIVTIFEGRNLLSTDWNGFSDPYCKVTIDPGHQDKQKTEIKKKDLNPVFNETFTFKFPTSTWQKGALVHIEIMDWDRIGRNDFMGAFGMPLDQVAEGKALNDKGGGYWFKLLDKEEGRSRWFYSEDQKTTAIISGDFLKKSTLKRKADMDKVKHKAKSAPPGTLDVGQFNLCKVLGKGSFGKVFLVEAKASKRFYALKQLKKLAVIDDDDVPATLGERRILSLGSQYETDVGARFMTTAVATFQNDSSLFFLMELVSGGDLMFMIMNKGAFSKDAVRFYDGEICLGMWFMHQKGIIYRDLKLDNVMVDSRGHVKIADFGMCKEDMSENATTKTFCGTPDYIAPEIVKYQPYGFSVDWWALGIMTFEMLTGQAPFDGESEEELFDSILTQDVEVSLINDASAKRFVSDLLHRTPSKRLGSEGGIKGGMEKIKNHEFFKGFNWKQCATGNLKPEYTPEEVKDPRDAVNFDPEFTNEKPVLSVPDRKAVAKIDQNVFNGFDWTSNKL